MGIHYNTSHFFSSGSSSRPSLYWDFANKKSAFDIINKIPLVFTRNSIGTYFDDAGVMQTASANVLRFDRDPITGENLGLMLEVGSTNLLLNSAALATQSVSVNATTYTLSFYGTGSVTLSGAYSATLVGIGTYPVRASLTFVVAAAGTLTLSVSGTVQCGQLEALPYASSYIPTAEATASRVAESGSVATSVNWYEPSSGTLFVEMKNSGYIGSAHAGTGVSLDNSQFQRNMITLNLQRDSPYYREGSLVIFPDSGSYVGQGTPGPSNNITNSSVFYKFAGSFSSNFLAFAYNGLSGTSTPVFNMPTISRLLINTNSNYAYDSFSGWIKSIRYYPTVFTADQLALLTKY